MNPLFITAVAMASVTFSVGFYHLFIYSRLRQGREHLAFALTCLAVGFYDVFCAGLYGAGSVSEGIRWQRLQLFALTIVTASFLWFVSEYTLRVSKTVLKGLAAVYGLVSIVQLFNPGGLAWLTDQPAVKNIRLPLGDIVTYHEVAYGPLTVGILMLMLVGFAYLFWCSLQFYREGPADKAEPLLWTLGLFIAGAANDAAVHAGLYEFIYTIEYAFMGVILLMASSLSGALARTVEIEEALHQSEEEYKNLVDNLNVGVFRDTGGPQGRFIKANPALARMFGFQSLNELMDVPICDLHLKLTDRTDFIDEVRQKGFISNKELQLRRRDGSHLIASCTAVIKYDEEGRLVHLDGILEDITEQKRAEADLRESEENYRSILESIQEGYFEVNLQGDLTFFNESMSRIAGYTPKELTNLNYKEYTTPETAKQMFEMFNQVYRTGQPAAVGEYDIIHKDGSIKTLELGASLKKDRQNQVTGFSGVVRDVTQRKKADEELRRLNEELEQRVAERTAQLEDTNQNLEEAIEATAKLAREAEAANVAKSEFLANMSHEIRTPLNGIIGMTELALETNLDDNQRNLLLTITTEANALLDVINDILDFSKVEAGMLEIEDTPFDLQLVMEGVANSVALGAQKKGLEFISFLAPNVPPRLLGDPVRLRQVLINLAGNAVKFTHEGDVLVKCELREDMGDKVRLHFFVKDTGVGIPRDKQGKIFDSFTQADGSTTRKYGGTGLGTAISKRLVELMGGEIGMESEEGKGSTFWFTVVLSKASEIPATAPDQLLDLTNTRALVVDDNVNNRYILLEYLMAWGCWPQEAASGLEALEKINTAVENDEIYDFILTDFKMPDMSGFDLGTQIRRNHRFDQVPIILLTSSGRLGDGQRCKEIGIDGYLNKPVKRDELFRAIESIMLAPLGHDIGRDQRLITRHSIAEEYGRQLEILLVEDYPTNQQVALRHLKGAGYRVELADNGQMAVETFRLKTFDMILMDIQMPVMDGYQATKEIRAIEAGKDATGAKRIPIIAMTARALTGDREKALEAGFDDYLTKPLRKKELLAMINKWTPRRDSIIPDVTATPIQHPADTSHTDKKIEEYTDVSSLPPESAMAADAFIGDEEPSEPESESDGSPLNWDQALHEFDGDQEFLDDVLAGYVSNVRDQITTIHRAISEGQADLVMREAHSIKGGALNLTASVLADAALTLEQIGRSGNLDNAFEALEHMAEAFQNLEAFSRSRSQQA